MDYYNNPYMARYQSLQMPEMFRGTNYQDKRQKTAQKRQLKSLKKFRRRDRLFFLPEKIKTKFQKPIDKLVTM